MGGRVQPTPIEDHSPYRSPRPLPPSDIFTRAQHVLVEEETPTGLQHVSDEVPYRAFRRGDRTQRQDGHYRVNRRLSRPQRFEDGGSVLSAAGDDDKRPVFLREARAGCGSPNVWVHSGVWFQSQVFRDFGSVEVSCGVAVAYGGKGYNFPNARFQS